MAGRGSSGRQPCGEHWAQCFPPASLLSRQAKLFCAVVDVKPSPCCLRFFSPKTPRALNLQPQRSQKKKALLDLDGRWTRGWIAGGKEEWSWLFFWHMDAITVSAFQRRSFESCAGLPAVLGREEEKGRKSPSCWETMSAFPILFLGTLAFLLLLGFYLTKLPPACSEIRSWWVGEKGFVRRKLLWKTVMSVVFEFCPFLVALWAGWQPEITNYPD